MTKLSVQSYAPGVARSEEGKRADTVVASLGSHMEQAAAMAAMAKTALHAVIRHRPTYERHIDRPWTKAKHAVVDKNKNLQASYFAAAEAFAYYAKYAMVSVNELIELMPQLIKGGDQYDSTTPSYGRKSNAALCSRLILAIPQEVLRLASQFQLDDKHEHYIHVHVGNTELGTLRSYLWDHNYQQRYDSNLTVPYIADDVVGPDCDGVLRELDKAMADIETVIARAQKLAKEFSDVKALYFSNRWEEVAPCAEEAIAEYKGLQVDYEIVRWTMENASEAISKAYWHLQEAMKAVERKFEHVHQAPILNNNLVAARSKMIFADEVRLSTSKLALRYCRPIDNDERTNKRHEQSAKALEEAFRGIPAVHRVSSLRFLDYPTRKQ